MNLDNKRILLTGATGGIGKELAKQLAHHKCQLVLTGRDKTALNAIEAELTPANESNITTIPADICDTDDCSRLINQANTQMQGLDILINLAGLQTFKPLSAISSAEIEKQIIVNLRAPILLAREACEIMMQQNSGQIVNIGSTFGSIGFANFSVYSATKFGLRGFSEALRRELKDTGINVNYIAPRATSTSMNSDSVYKMAEETGMNLDSPVKVANEIIKAIINNKKNYFIGFPENIFSRINALVPNLVDKALHKQNLIARKYV